MMGIQQGTSPTRLLEMLSDRFGAFEAIASSSIKLTRVAPEEELAMEPIVAEAVLEFAEDARCGQGGGPVGAGALKSRVSFRLLR